ncbi:MAG: DUF4402 domain-containing protein [Pseudomonadota bacterium]
MTKLKLLALASAAALISAPALAADANSSAGAEIVSPLQVTNTTALYFGTIAPSFTNGDTVVVSTAGAKACGSELTCLTADHTAAAFSVAGEADQTYTITLPSSVAISNGSGGSMTVDAFTGSKSTGTLVAGTDTFTVGGQLNVAANQATGEYTGTFAVTVEYQ